jgi:integrase
MERVKGIEPSFRFTHPKVRKQACFRMFSELILDLFISTFISTRIMASVVKHKRSKYWNACYTDRDGKQRQRSTRTTDRNQALEIAIGFERVEQQARAGNLTTIQVKKVINDISVKVTGESILAPAVNVYLNDWLDCIKVRNTPATVERYKNTVKIFLAYLGDAANRPITGITPEHIEGFLNARLAKKVAPKTAILDLKTLSIAFRRAEVYGTILKNPVPPIRLPKAQSSERDVFTHEEVLKLLNACPNVEWQTLILVGFFTGARLSDCVQMAWENIDSDLGAIVYLQKKTGKKVIVPMHFQLLQHISYLSKFGTEGFLCPTLAPRGSGGKHGLSESFKRIMNKAGIDAMTVKGLGTRQFSRRTFHSLRHSFNSVLANAGVSPEIRMQLTGHSSMAMNARYTHLTLAPLKNAITLLHTSKPAASDGKKEPEDGQTTERQIETE